jgi:hypothetical protein
VRIEARLAADEDVRVGGYRGNSLFSGYQWFGAQVSTGTDLVWYVQIDSYWHVVLVAVNAAMVSANLIVVGFVIDRS